VAIRYVPVVGAQLHTKTTLAAQYGVTTETINKWIRGTKVTVKIPPNGAPFTYEDIIKLHFCWVAMRLYKFDYDSYKDNVVYAGLEKKFHVAFSSIYGGGDLRKALEFRLSLTPPKKKDRLADKQVIVIRQVIEYIDYLERLENTDEEFGPGNFGIGTEYQCA
jgi:hypothetical protein